MAILDVQHIEKSFGSTKVLRDINFSLAEGQVLAIIGSSGSGKTTLLRCLNFLETPDKGTISVRDEVLFDAADPATQREAAQVLGMTKRQIFFKVTLLQMIKRIVPPMSNEIITLVKDTSIARIISMQEIIWAGYAFLKGSHGYSGLLWPLFFTGVYYLIFNGLLTILFAGVEKKLAFFQ